MADSDKSLYSLRYNQTTSNLEAFGGGSPQWTNITLNNVDPTQVPVTRQINTTAPLQGGGNLTADRTLSIPQATSSVDGYLFHTDWTTFNSKLTSILNSANIFVGNGSNVAVGVALSGDASLSNAGALTFNTVNANVGTFTNAQITVNAKGLITAASSGTIGSLTDAGTDGITITGGTNAVLGTGTSIAQHVADTTHNGYLSSTDWNTFNGKQPAGNYITALTGDVTATGPGSVAATLATVNGNVGSFTYASITVNAKGLITAASSGTAPVTSVSGTAGDISSTGGTTPVLDLVNTAVTPATYTYATLTVDAKGRLTSASSGTAPVTSVSGTANQISSTGGTTPVLSLSSTLQLPGTLQLGGDENANSHKITNLTNGSAAQDAAAFGQIPVFTDWASYTPTITGCGTVSAVSFRWMQMGNHIYVKGFFTCGTTAAAAISVTLPNGTVISNTKAAANFLLGIPLRIITAAGASNATPWFVFYDGTNTNLAYITQQTASNNFVKNNGSDIFANGDSCTLFFDYPI